MKLASMENSSSYKLMYSVAHSLKNIYHNQTEVTFPSFLFRCKFVPLLYQQVTSHESESFILFKAQNRWRFSINFMLRNNFYRTKNVKKISLFFLVFVRRRTGTKVSLLKGCKMQRYKFNP